MLDVLNFMSDLEAQLSKMCTAVDHSWMRIRIETSCDIVVVFFKLKFEVNLELEVGLTSLRVWGYYFEILPM